MAEKKKQHFVPRFYLRNFSFEDGRRISLFLIDDDKHVPGASIKDQAYKNYLYGKAGAEDKLSALEAAVSPIVAKAITENILPDPKSEAHHSLLTFVLFQHARTPALAASLNEHTEKFVRLIARDFPDLKD